MRLIAFKNIKAIFGEGRESKTVKEIAFDLAAGWLFWITVDLILGILCAVVSIVASYWLPGVWKFGLLVLALGIGAPIFMTGGFALSALSQNLPVRDVLRETFNIIKKS